MKTNNTKTNNDAWMEKVLQEVKEKETENNDNRDPFDVIDSIFRQGEQAGLCNWIRF